MGALTTCRFISYNMPWPGLLKVASCLAFIVLNRSGKRFHNTVSENGARRPAYTSGTIPSNHCRLPGWWMTSENDHNLIILQRRSGPWLIYCYQNLSSNKKITVCTYENIAKVASCHTWEFPLEGTNMEIITFKFQCMLSKPWK